MKWHLRWMTFTFGLWLACAAPGARAERSLAIVFTNDARLGTLSNFPALVELSTSISNFSYGDFLSTDGYDLRFWSDDAKTEELDYEIERWDTNALAAAFSPTSINNIKVWYRADQGALTDGSGTVTNWTDQSGNGNNALLINGTPTLVTNVVNGQPVVRFDVQNSGNHYGEYLRFTRLTDIRTVFWVVKDDHSLNSPFLLGDQSSYDFSRNSGGQFWDGYTSANIKNGTTRLDGSSVDGTATVLSTGVWHVVSLVTAGNVNADQICQDRSFHGSWYGDIAEIIIYNRALTDTEEQQVGTYLARKYRIASYYQQGSSYAWVRVPTLTNGASIAATWGNAGDSNRLDCTTNGACGRRRESS